MKFLDKKQLKQFHTAEDIELERVLPQLENDLQKVIYLDWWYGGYLWKLNRRTGEFNKADKYKYVNEHDWKMASKFIMETISNGMG